jgi:hypothetical protein
MVTKAELDKALEGTKAEFDKALDGIRAQFDDLHTTTNHKLDEYSVRQERQFADFLDQAQSSDAQTQSLLVSMHATSNNPCSNTMRFKGQIGTFSIFALIDSESSKTFPTWYYL